MDARLATLALRFRPRELRKKLGPLDLVIVVSHDCDVVNADFLKEPRVEVAHAVADPTRDQPDGNFSYGKSPRELQLRTAAAGTAMTYVIRADERWQIPRRLLGDAGPAFLLETDLIPLVAKWLGRRYDRGALPSTFVERTRAASGAIEREMKRNAQNVVALLVSLSSHAELPPGTSYRTEVFALMRETDFLDPAKRSAVATAMTVIEASLAECEGIDLGTVEAISEGELTISEYRGLVPWEYDYLSHRLGPRITTPPRA